MLALALCLGLGAPVDNHAQSPLARCSNVETLLELPRNHLPCQKAGTSLLCMLTLWCCRLQTNEYPARANQLPPNKITASGTPRFRVYDSLGVSPLQPAYDFFDQPDAIKYDAFNQLVIQYTVTDIGAGLSNVLVTCVPSQHLLGVQSCHAHLDQACMDIPAFCLKRHCCTQALAENALMGPCQIQSVKYLQEDDRCTPCKISKLRTFIKELEPSLMLVLALLMQLLHQRRSLDNHH